MTWKTRHGIFFETDRILQREWNQDSVGNFVLGTGVEAKV